MDSIIVIPIVVFFITALVSITSIIFTTSFIERRSILKKISKGGAGHAWGGHASPPTQKQSMLKQFFLGAASQLGNIAKPKNEETLSRVQENLLSLGYKSVNAAKIFSGIKVLFAIILPATFFFLETFIQIQISPLLMLSGYIFLVLIGFYLPEIWLRMKIARRKEKILEGFPDALDMLVVCVESGMGMDSAIDRVAREMQYGNKPLSEEFKLYNREMRLGKSRRDALKGLASRIKLEQVKSLVTLLIQTDKFGTSIAQSLRAHSDFLRVQRHLLAEEKAAKLALKLLFPLIFFIFPSLFVIILGPAIISALVAFKQ
ncbi:MAG TPA: type II secretion system F family protein [Candidatus Brocadiaceae bacterium]